MCGIAGEVRFDGGVATPPLKALSSGIRHRGPDDDGLWIDEQNRCGFGFRRLSIIDLSPLGHQPMIDPETGNVIVYNGEVYNFQELRRDCESAGAHFRSRSDTEVILALYRRFGPECVKKLRGMFALAIWDVRQSHLFLARDRFGKKPLNYALTKTGLVFCSEIDPLSRHPAVSRVQDIDALELYLQFLCIPAPWTIYQQIRKLPPAHWAVFSRSGLRIEQYWDLNYSRKIELSDSEVLEAFEEKFTEAVRLRMISDVPLGALLSGGVDSSAVVAAMAKLSSTPVKTFSIGFHEQDFDELPYAEEVARVCGTDHHPQIVTGDVQSILPSLVRHYGEPFADPSAIPSFYVCKAARANVTVVLNGDGGDELLGGYPRYAVSSLSLMSSRIFGQLFPAESLVNMAANPSGGPEFVARSFSRLVRDLLHPELGSLMNYRNNWHDSMRRDLLRRDRTGRVVPQWRREWFGRASANSSNPVDWMLYFDNHTQLPNDLLVKMDIASMHCGLEARSPLLDHELAEFCAGLPLDLKVRNDSGKFLLKRLAAKSFGEAFVNRPKQGFGIPLNAWLQGPLRSTLLEVLSDHTLMEPFDSAVVSRAVREFLSGRRRPDHTARLWGLLMYGLWRHHTDADAAAPAVPTQAPAGGRLAVA